MQAHQYNPNYSSIFFQWEQRTQNRKGQKKKTENTHWTYWWSNEHKQGYFMGLTRADQKLFKSLMCNKQAHKTHKILIPKLKKLLMQNGKYLNKSMKNWLLHIVIFIPKADFGLSQNNQYLEAMKVSRQKLYGMFLWLFMSKMWETDFWIEQKGLSE